MINAPPAPADISQRIPLYLGWVAYGVILCTLFGGWLIHASSTPDLLGELYGRDFLYAYMGMQAVAQGHGPQIYSPDAHLQILQALPGMPAPLIETRSYVWPAYNGMLLAPLGLLPYPAAFLVWDSINLLVIGGVLYRLARYSARPGGARPLLFLAGAAFAPVFITLIQGQFSFFPLLGLAGAWLALAAGRERAAGAWLLCGLLKPQLILVPLLALLVGRHWRTLAVFAAGSAAVLLASFLVCGNWLPAYVQLLTGQNTPGGVSGDWPGLMLNWRSIIYTLLGEDTTPLAVALRTGLAVVTLAAVVALAWPRPQGSRVPAEVGFGVAVLAGLLIVPHVYPHDGAVALVAGFLFWRASHPAPTRQEEPPGAGRRHLLRRLLGVGPVVMFLSLLIGSLQFHPGAWYFAALLACVLWAWKTPGNGRQTVDTSSSISST